MNSDQIPATIKLKYKKKDTLHQHKSKKRVIFYKWFCLGIEINRPSFEVVTAVLIDVYTITEFFGSFKSIIIIKISIGIWVKKEGYII